MSVVALILGFVIVAVTVGDLINTLVTTASTRGRWRLGVALDAALHVELMLTRRTCGAGMSPSSST